MNLGAAKILISRIRFLALTKPRFYSLKLKNMNQHQEDYLKTIFTLGRGTGIVNNKAIADELLISPASVTEMLAKLSKNGYVEVFPYRGVRLTELGVKTCQDIVTSHRLWEVFLTKHLGYQWGEAHEDAHILEHVAPERLLKRLDAFLGHPKHCPHGAEIPRGDFYNIEIKEYAFLSELRPGASAIVRKIEEKAALLNYIEKLGLKVDAEIKVLDVGEYESSIVLEQEGQQISISHKAATQISVEKI